MLAITCGVAQERGGGVFVANDALEADTLSGDTLVGDTLSYGCAEVLPWPHGMRAEIDTLLKSAIFQKSQVGIEIYDLDADSIVYAHGEKQTLRPASTMKLLTAVTALSLIGRDFEYSTGLYMAGEIVDSTLIGDLYCRGGFDPAFNYTDMSEFARVVKSIGIDSISGFIYADLSMKDNVTKGEGWSWDDHTPTLSPLLVERKTDFCEQLVERLRDYGVGLNVATSINQVPDTATELTTCRRNIDQILLPMMKESDNLYAESMFFKIAEASAKAPVSASDARKAEGRLLAKLGFGSDNYRIADGSGLSLYNYLSPEIEVAILKYAYRDDYVRSHLLPSLPEAGFNGTLRKRMRTGAAAGNIQAKTGTLAGVITLAGYAIANNGHRLCFSIMNQGVMKASLARNFQDKVCQAMCK